MKSIKSTENKMILNPKTKSEHRAYNTRPHQTAGEDTNKRNQMMPPHEAEKLNKNRRNFLKILLIGGGTVLVGKFFGSNILDFLAGPETSKDFETFKVDESRKALTIYDKNGEEILVIDKI